MTDQNTYYALVQITSDKPIRDVESHVRTSLRQVALFDPAYRVEVAELTREQAARKEAVDMDVHNFVAIEEDDMPNVWQVHVYEQDGTNRQVMRDSRGTCSVAAQIIADTLRTWEGWK